MDVEIHLSETRGELWSRERKVGKHKRKLNGQEYVAPRIVLPPEYNHLIGKSFELDVCPQRIQPRTVDHL